MESSHLLHMVQVQTLQLSQVPIIDLSLFHHQQDPDQLFRSLAIQQIHQACQNHGFFHIINHGICESVLQEALDVNLDFFELPMEMKQELMSDDCLKHVRFGKLEGEYKGEGKFFRNFLKFYANPIEDFIDLWPQHPPNYREKMGAYTLQVRKLGIEILGYIMESLGLGSTYMKQDFGQGIHMMGINNYPPLSISNIKMGIPPHTDHGFITILLQVKPGLHVMDRVDGSWKALPVVERSLVVLVGDHLEVLSNGVFKSVAHRAIPCSDETRLSIGSWNSLGLDEVVEPAKELVDEEHPRKYKGSSFKDFLDHISSREAKPFIETLKLC